MDARLGFVTQMEMDHLDAVEFAGTAGFDYIEVMLDGPAERGRLDVDALRSAREDAGVGLAVHLPFGGVDVASPLSEVREGSLRELEAAIDAAAAAGATTAVAHAETDAWRGAWGADDLRGTLHDAVERLDRYGRERGVVVCFENIPRGLFTTHDLRDLFAETEAAATLDTGHARMDGVDAGGMAAIVRDHPDRVRHVHLNDTRRAADEHLPFGAGTIDFETLFAAFPADWGGTLSLEVFTESYDYVAESLAQLRRVLDGV